MKFYEARALRKCEKIIVVVPEAAERLYGYGISDDKILLVSNTEDETTFPFDDKKIDINILEKYKKYWVASYIGGVGPHRGIDTALNAVPYLVKKIPNFLFLIVGASEKQLEEIQKKAFALKIDENISVLKWRPFSEVNSIIAASNVCLVPHNDFEHTQTTIPHKLFQYMICCKPVLVSSCRPLARVVSETGAGLVFQANNSNSLSDALYYMYNNPSECTEMGRRGNFASLTKYSWKNDAERLIKMYKDLEDAR